MNRIEQILANLCEQVYSAADCMDVKWLMEGKGRIELLEVEQKNSQPQRSEAILHLLIPQLEQHDRSQVYQLLMQVSSSPSHPCTLTELHKLGSESIARMPSQVRLFKQIYQPDPSLGDRLRVCLLLWTKSELA
ncbi:hypothetical protein [Spirosoma koreense]